VAGSFSLRRDLEALALASLPREACGFLLGERDGSAATVLAVLSATNRVTDRNDRFELEPLDLLAADARARAERREIVGLWHSHPDRPARPSELDRERACGGWSYLIVSVGAEGARELRSWRRLGDGFAEESVEEGADGSLVLRGL
jgi:proteasome lid subunit RPN8/RPN11